MDDGFIYIKIRGSLAKSTVPARVDRILTVSWANLARRITIRQRRGGEGGSAAARAGDGSRPYGSIGSTAELGSAGQRRAAPAEPAAGGGAVAGVHRIRCSGGRFGAQEDLGG